MADCYVHLKDITQAVEVLSQAKARLPQRRLRCPAGRDLSESGGLPHAGAAWEEALKADPQRDDVRLKLTLIYDQLHRPARYGPAF